jgi:magnesium transporter
VTEQGAQPDSKRRSPPPATKTSENARPSGGTGMKALILDGESTHETTSFDEIAEAHAQGKRFWVELDEKTPSAEKLLEEVFKIHPLAIEDLWADIGLPKVEDFGSYVQIVMHGVREEDRAGREVPLALAELDIIIGPNYLVTHAHDEKVCAVAPVQAEVARNARLLKKGPAWVAHALLDRLVDEYLPLIDRFDEQIETVEEQILEGKVPLNDTGPLHRILRIKRSLQMLRRVTIYQREILLRIVRAEFDEIPDELTPFYRDVYDHMARVTELVDSYRELTSGLLEAHFSIQSQQMNEIMKRLTLISTIMLPLTLIAGIYGMNFEKMPELKWEHGYFFALALMIGVATFVIAYFRSKKWL